MKECVGVVRRLNAQAQTVTSVAVWLKPGVAFALVRAVGERAHLVNKEETASADEFCEYAIHCYSSNCVW